MRGLVRSLFSSIGSKTIVALTGLALTAFVILHMLGNLQIYLGREVINAYGAFLQGSVELLWPMRITLLTVFVIHVAFAVRLWFANRAARPDRYAVSKTMQATPGSRTMLISGLVLLTFIAYHLAHFTLGLTDPKAYDQEEVMQPAVVGTVPGTSQPVTLDEKKRHDVYNMMVKGFQWPGVSFLYILCMIFLGLHLSHGVPSMLQTLGLNNQSYAATLRKVGVGVAILVVLGNVSIPLSVLLGLLRPVTEATP
ncbi:MAG TPA: succinate dehydrogenase cytochrome b subunit [Gemmataceae bacterium]|nr:succinate dehydrogenase cytochrome b subunit [Gemmataceae bacterium]